MGTGIKVTGMQTVGGLEALRGADLGSEWYVLEDSSKGVETDLSCLGGGAVNLPLCTWSTWYFSLSFLLKVALQCGQLKGRASEWITMCFVRVFLIRKV